MPTENRSSNTDPRDLFIRLNPLGLGEAELRKDSTGFEDQRTHSDYLLFLAGYRESQQAQQHNAEPGYPPCDYCGIPPDYHPWHGSGMINGVENRHIHACDGCRWKLPSHPGQLHPEPIAWMVGTAFWWTKEEAERDAAATGLPVVGLGPMTDPGDVEQLREVIKHSDAQIMRQSMRISNQRAQLAERDELLRDVHGAMREYEQGCDQFPPFHHNRLMERIDAALLSASADPSAPGVLPRAHDVNMFQRTAEPGAKS